MLGRTLSIDGRAVPIIGVAPPRFHGFIVKNSADVWISSPLSNRELMMIARLKPDVTAAQAQPAVHGLLTSVLQQRLNDFAPNLPIETELVPAGQGLSQLRGQYQGALLALMVLVTLVLLTTCTNVGNLLMVRNASRNRELTGTRRARRRPIALDSSIPHRERAAGRRGLRLGSGPGPMGRLDQCVDASLAGNSGKPDVLR